MQENPFASVTLTATTHQNLATLTEFAEFWKIPHDLSPDSRTKQILVSSGIPQSESSLHTNPAIIIPSSIQDCSELARIYNLHFSEKQAKLRLAIAPGTFTAIRATVWEFQGPNLVQELTSDGISILSRPQGTETHFLAVDIISEYSRLIHGGLEDCPSTKFRLVAALPVAYNVIPQTLRNWSLRRAHASAETGEERTGPVECLRTIFLASILISANAQVPRISFWRDEKKYALTVTHDVESKEGLERARDLLDVERKLVIRSTWNLPSDRFPITNESARRLAESGEIGAHDTLHDGRLILGSSNEIIERAVQCREKLEATGRTRVLGFRAPLLQHSSKLLAALGKAGYEFDSSVPSWETLSPTSLKPHGIGTVFPLEIGELIEIPVSLPQDHQLLKILGLTVEETVRKLLELSKWIRTIGGICVILVHPDYEFGSPEHQHEYEQLLVEFQKDSECDIMTLKEAADWWKKRSNAFVDFFDGIPLIRAKRNLAVLEDLGLEIVVGYSSEGFETRRLHKDSTTYSRSRTEESVGG